MTVEGIDLLMARREAEAGMVDFCKIGFKTRSDVIDEATGTYPETITDPVYEGKCRIVMGMASAHEIDAQAQALVETDSHLSLPVTFASGSVQKNMVAEILEAGYDFSLVGVQVRITGPYRQSIATSRKFRVEETS